MPLLKSDETDDVKITLKRKKSPQSQSQDSTNIAQLTANFVPILAADSQAKKTVYLGWFGAADQSTGAANSPLAFETHL
ncbi:MAG: hypothetical protein AAFQ63_07110 [Cyanobacteria bacterium J06621_11]